MAGHSLLWLCTFFSVALKLASSSDFLVAKSNGDLTLSLVRNLAQKQGNFVVSPSSVLTGLAMLYEGMGDSSRQVVDQTLNWSQNYNRVIKEFQEISETNSSSKSDLNMIVVAVQAEIKPSYGNRIKTLFKAQPYRQNFEEKQEVALKSINVKVSRKSKGQLKQFLSPGSITAYTKLVLVNVLHFKSDWSEKFGSDLIEAPFYLDNSDEISASFMFGSFNGAGHQALSEEGAVVRLPFQDQDFAMIFIKPPKSKGIESFVQEDLAALMPSIMNPDSLKNVSLSLQLPNFNLEKRTNLKDVLSKINGLDHIFSKDVDFSRMANSSLTVQDVNHMAVVDVNTNGVEASAATSISVVPYSAFVPDLLVTLDRSFLFFIVEKPTRMIMFAGAIKNPTDLQ